MMSNRGKIKLPETGILFDLFIFRVPERWTPCLGSSTNTISHTFFALKKFNTWIFIDGYNLIYVHNGWESKKKQLRVDDMAQTKKTGI